MIAHVAPEFGSGRLSNTLRVGPQYRVALRLGSIDELFSSPLPSALENGDRAAAYALMARMRVLGLFYYPSDHPDAEWKFEASWKGFKETILGGAGDARAIRTIAEWLESRIVTLPAPGEFAKIRLPGGFTPLPGPRDPSYPYVFGNDLPEVEDAFYAACPVLGKIPLVAVVEKRATPASPWGPADEDLAVRFQIIEAEPLPAFDPARDANGQIGRPPLPPGPGRNVEAEERRHPEAVLPQGRNAHVDRGGKRGRRAAGSLFSTDRVPGFHEPHPVRGIDHPLFAPSEEVEYDAVRTRTNREGKAGALFLPSRCGGDRYQVLVTVEGARVRTGTLVVWRNVRLSRYWRAEVGAPEPRITVADLHRVGLQDGAGLPRLNLEARRPLDAPFPGVIDQFARAFCEVEIDWGGLEPARIEGDTWRLMREQAIVAGEARLRALEVPVDFRRLFRMDEPGLAPESALCLLPMLSPREYNDGAAERVRIPLVEDPLTGVRQYSVARIRDIGECIERAMFFALLDYLSEIQSLPGLTIVQAAALSGWHLTGVLRNSTAGQSHRRSLVYYRGAAHFPARVGDPAVMYRDYTTSVCHEIGHSLYRPHAPGNDPGRGAAEGIRPAQHDHLSDSVCVMSYKTGDGFFCGKCLLALRGWRLA